MKRTVEENITGKFVRRSICLAGHLWPLHRGYWRLTKSWLVRRYFDPLTQNPYLSHLRNGVPVWTDPSDYNGRMIAVFGTAEPIITKLCQRLLRAGDIFLDVGANYGSVGLQCYDRVGDEGEVHLFEPQVALCERIVRTIEAIGSKRISVHPIALMDRDGSMDLYLSARHSGAATLIAYTGKTNAIRVTVRKASVYVPPIVNGRPWAAKLDVEGAEICILTELLQIPHMRFLVFECNRPETRGPILSLMARFGVAVFGIPNSLLRIRLDPVDSLDQMRRYGDFLGLPCHMVNTLMI